MSGGAYIDALTGDFVLLASKDLQQPDNPTLQSVQIRLQTQRGSCFWDLQFGSRLHELPRAKMHPAIEAEAEAYVREALQPMVDAGELLELAVAARRADRNRLELVVRAMDAGLRPLSFQLFVPV